MMMSGYQKETTATIQSSAGARLYNVANFQWKYDKENRKHLITVPSQNDLN